MTATWFAQRPTFWPHAVALAIFKFKPNQDSASIRKKAGAWAAARVVSLGEALQRIGLSPVGNIPILPEDVVAEARSLALLAKAKMGGPGHLDLIYAATKLSGAQRVVETGVAYGWSSLAILAALADRPNARLVSVDMPYPKMNNEDDVGVAVPARFRAPWSLVRAPDRRGIAKAISLVGGSIDLCHYDSDKSYYGREFAYPLLWNALGSGGIFISDDIQDNFAFREFVEGLGLDFAVTTSEGKYVGVIRKPKAMGSLSKKKAGAPRRTGKPAADRLRDAHPCAFVEGGLDEGEGFSRGLEQRDRVIAVVDIGRWARPTLAP